MRGNLTMLYESTMLIYITKLQRCQNFLRFLCCKSEPRAMHFASVCFPLPPFSILPRSMDVTRPVWQLPLPLSPSSHLQRKRGGGMAWTDLRTVDKKQFRASVSPVNPTTWSSAAEEEKRIASNNIDGSGKKQLNTFRWESISTCHVYSSFLSLEIQKSTE